MWGSMSRIISNKPYLQSIYNASKAAVDVLTKSLATEWAHQRSRINAVLATYIATDMTKNELKNNEFRTPGWK